MPSGLGESPGGYGSTPGGWGGGGRDTSFGSYTEDDGNGGYNTINVGDYGMSPSDSGYGYNPDYGGVGPSQNWDGGNTFADAFSGYAAPPSYSADNMFGYTPPNVNPPWQGAVNLPQVKGPTDAPQEGGFWDSEFGKNLKRFGLFALRVHPATRGPMAIYGAMNDLMGGKPSQGLGSLIGMATKNPMLGGLASLGMDAYNGQPVGGQLGSRVGGMAGGMAGGPVGAALGSMAGGAIGQGYDQGRTSAPPGSPGGGNQGGAGDTLGAGLTSLAALYMANRQRQTAQDQQRQQQQQMQTLQQMFPQGGPLSQPSAPHVRQPNMAGIGRQMEAMFGAGSKTAATLRTQLERKDAAAGRRSQYGPREVELLARLAQMRAQAEPSYMNAEIAAANAANQGAYQMYSAQQSAYNNYIQNMLRGQQLGGVNMSSAYQAQQAADAARQQQLAAILYGARETGLFDAAANWWGGQ